VLSNALNKISLSVVL